MDDRALGLPSASQAVVLLPKTAVGAIGRGLESGSNTGELEDA